MSVATEKITTATAKSMIVVLAPKIQTVGKVCLVWRGFAERATVQADKLSVQEDASNSRLRIHTVVLAEMLVLQGKSVKKASVFAQAAKRTAVRAVWR